MNTVVFAYHNMGLTGLEALKRAGFNIRAIFSHEDDPSENCWFGSVVSWAKKNEIQVYSPDNVNRPEWIEKISSISPDIIFSFYYRYMISQAILKIPPHGAYNLHGSLLPSYRGRAPVNWVLVNGEKKTGVTLHHMIEKADAGDIILQKSVDISLKDTAITLYEKLCGASKQLLDEVLPEMKAGKAKRTPQDLSKGSYFGKRTPEDGKINWEWEALRIYNLIRGVTHPYPGAFTFMPDGEKLLIWWGEIEREIFSDLTYGELFLEKDKVFIKAKESSIKLADIEINGNRMKDNQIFQNFKDKKGMILS